MIRVLFFGTSEFAVPSLTALANDTRFEVLGVVTQPDKPTGRGQQMSESPVKRAAQALGLPVDQPKRVRSPEFIEAVRQRKPDSIALAAYGQLIPQSLLDIPRLGPINVHGSLLPKYRGAAPIQRAIMEGEAETGITTMWMDATLDTGDILLSAKTAIEPNDTSGSLLAKLAELGGDILVNTLVALDAGRCVRHPQSHGDATLAPMICPHDSAISWNEPAQKTVNRMRALSPRPGVYTHYHGKRLKVWAAAAVDGNSAQPGIIVQLSKGGVTVSTPDKCLLMSEVQPENRAKMTAADWARGARIALGDTFDITELEIG